MLEIIKYSSYVVFPFIGMLMHLFRKKSARVNKIIVVLILLISVIFIWARFMEPNLITVNESTISIGLNKKVALIADTHLGVFKDNDYLERAVSKINNIENIDAVFVAGDLTFYSKDIAKDLSPFADIEVPVYAVLGNHDEGFPGPDVNEDVRKVLDDAGVNIIESEVFEYGDGIVVGLGDKWANKDNVNILKKIESDKPTVVLTHNPDTTLDYPISAKRDNLITLSGHTHCGQVRLWPFYKLAIPTDNEFNQKNLQDDTTNGKVFITCGLGEVGLPLRLFNPPVINIINL